MQRRTVPPPVSPGVQLRPIVDDNINETLANKPAYLRMLERKLEAELLRRGTVALEDIVIDSTEADAKLRRQMNTLEAVNELFERFISQSKTYKQFLATVKERYDLAVSMLTKRTTQLTRIKGTHEATCSALVDQVHQTEVKLSLRLK